MGTAWVEKPSQSRELQESSLAHLKAFQTMGGSPALSLTAEFTAQ